MMKKIPVLLLSGFIILFVCSVSSVADEICFRCTVNNEYYLTDDGQLVKPKKHYYLNSAFSVSKDRGVAENLAVRNWQEGKMKSFVGIDYLQVVVTGVCD